VMLQVVTGWSLLTCVLAGTAVSTIYLATGGFRADVYTDVFEFVMMFIGFGVVIPFAVAGFGGLEFIRENVPPLHLTWHGGNSMQFIAVWFFIALWTLVDPSFHQRCYAARSGKVAQKGILVSIVFWFVFDAMTATAGLYARAVLPQLENPVMAFPMLAEVALPPAAKGLFFVGMLATVMSSLNTLAFVSASTVGRDIVWRLSRSGDESIAVRYTRWGLLATAVLSIILTIAIPSVIKLWYTIGTVIIPGLLIPLVTSYFDRLRVAPAFAFATMLAGWLTSMSWLSAGWLEEFGSSTHFPLGVEPMFPGVIASAAVWGVGMWRKQRVNS
jgi:SSS family solute:Na+ symporter